MIIFLDTETTGLRPGNICQLSYIIQHEGRVKSKNFFFSVEYVEPSAQSVHGFSVEKLELLSGGKGFEFFAKEISEDLEKADVVCAHNTSFDFMFLSKELSCTRYDFNVKEEFCSMKNSVSFCKLPRNKTKGYKYPKLNELCQILGISDVEIAYTTKQLFGEEVGFHDARFDTSALFLAVNKGANLVPSMQKLTKYL